ncbi:putative PEP-CTERM system TPR-repeat lipoprotein [Pelomonas saccharophila]|uniref:PEP-CTERM system TPR-repeat lipoprotein n=1 Tax=Roseateles saccharophilus TaxID=304 RepID=A0ABU1YQN7_ROSSA|nr:XrtA/PEP-CTERM system TPR-repeat protein PrsT [Roseateles saccharophilus]MDR7271178.1 putative PEP-CTERM system TPR-repeat lipoprotein [Roseateles saccharophilus]
MTKKHKLRPVRLAGALLAASLLLTACFDEGAPQLVASGKARMEKKEYKAAAIDFKNALQKDSTQVEARFLLGKALLETGDVQGAWVELSKAREAGFNNDELVPVMAAALILRGENDKFIAEYADVQLTAPQRQAELKAALAIAYGGKGKYVQARAAAEAALQADPNNIVAQLAIAQLLMVSGDKTGALAQVDKTLKAHPESSRPWVAKADLLQASGSEPADVMAAYREALKLDKGDMQAHLGVIQLLQRQRDFDGMQKQLEELEKVQPGGLQGRYFKTVLAFERRDLKTAFELSQQLLKVAPQNPRFLQLAGMIEYERGGYLQAVAHLGKALANSPTPNTVRVLMARAQLRAGDPRKALSFVQPLLDNDNPAPADVYSVAADAYLQMGNSEAAKRMYTKAVKINPGDTRGRTALALADLSEGRGDRALAELKILAGADSGIEADVVMAMAHLRSNRLDEAVAVVDGIEKKQPGKPIAAFLRGRIEQLRGHRDKARAGYEESVKRSAAYLPAATALAAMDYEEGKPAAAVGRYEKVVAADPQSVEATMGLISAKARNGAKAEETRSQLEAAIKRFPEVEAPRLGLVSHLLEIGDAKGALQAANDGVSRFPDNPFLYEALGVAESTTGNFNQAAQSFSKMAALQPNSVQPLMRMEELQEARKDIPAAIVQLRKVLSMKPDHLPAQVRLITLLSRTGKSAEALALAKTVQTQSPNEPQGWTFEGDLLASQGKWPGAIAALRTSFAKRPAEDTAIKLHRALLSGGQPAEAAKLEAEWLAKQGDSPLFNFYLGDQAMARNDFERAELRYRKVVDAQPGNAVALNNLGWLLHRAGKPGALDMVEKALALAPNTPAVIDTAAEIQAATGHLDKALPLQKRAVELNPEQPMHRLHLAQYLIKNGQKVEARTELQRLAALGSNFSQQQEVQKLLASL